jgi:glycogen operon protein
MSTAVAFNLASILSRDQDGRPMTSPPILRNIESNPVLVNTKLIAEAWDAAVSIRSGALSATAGRE